MGLFDRFPQRAHADAEHTYGHGKIESLGGLIGGIAIFLIACFFIY